jgi:hypothetical protein
VSKNETEDYGTWPIKNSLKRLRLLVDQAESAVSGIHVDNEIRHLASMMEMEVDRFKGVVSNFITRRDVRKP